ncbi:FecR domain-containing protein [Echinicola marina]|uniref:FecR family protein n=1 Tax=Echinicola marina TaxID=2859768 RepID=UPI001CF687D4|nr:FecR domain-containing protein [Echinicola marina]UCS92119.1 FecR domain-containing protein [Echinicola marina]
MKEERPHPRELKMLIDKALQGKLTAEEKMILDQWYTSFEEVLPVVYSDLSKEDFKMKFYQETLEKIENNKARINSPRFLWRKIAASVVLLAATISVLFYILPKGANDLSYIEYSTGKGERKSVLLSDGSKVVLDGHTQLLVADNFEGQRNVKLIGRAFFEVKRNEASPFTISTESLKTTVLGTSFVIDALPGGQEAVAVKSGRVQVAYGIKDEVVLQQGEQALLVENTLGHSVIKNPLEVFGWMENKLVFYNDDLDEVASKIGNWYGVKIDLKVSPENTCLLTGTYSNLKLSELLEVISFSIPIKYEINDATVKIISEACE